MTRSRRRFAVLFAFAGVFPATASVAPAAPFWLEGFGDYRVVDASGRVAPRIDADAPGRNAYRPVFSPPPLFRARPFYPSGYAGAGYGPNRVPVPTGYRTGVTKPCGHTGACRHGR